MASAKGNGTDGMCCATGQQSDTDASATRCATVSIKPKCSVNTMKLHCGDDCAISRYGVCDADGVLAAALPCSYLKVRALNFTKLLPRLELRCFCGDAPHGIPRFDMLTIKGHCRRSLGDVVIDPLYEYTEARYSSSRAFCDSGIALRVSERTKEETAQ